MTDPISADAGELHDLLATELARGEDELLISLVPEHLASRLYSRGGLIAHGRAILTSTLAQVRGPVCRAYRSNKDSVRDAVDAAVIIVPIIAASATGAPVLTLAALIAKIGLARLCLEQSDPGPTDPGRSDPGRSDDG